MSKYELCLIINAKVDEEKRQAALEKAKGYIDRFGGTITKEDEWGKRRLAYEIEKVTEGFYYLIQFESETSAPAEIEKRLRIMEPVLRFLITNQDEK